MLPCQKSEGECYLAKNLKSISKPKKAHNPYKVLVSYLILLIYWLFYFKCILQIEG